jgi:hypothetical protein
MQHHRAGGARYRAIKVIQVAKQIAVKQTETAQCWQSRSRAGLFHHLEVIVADAFLAAFAVAVDETTVILFAARWCRSSATPAAPPSARRTLNCRMFI